jgi:uncharacterized protein
VGPNSAITSMRIGSQDVQIGGSTALLTGAAGGIGEAIARALAERDVRLLLSGRRREPLESLAGELGATALVADLSVPAELERLVEQAGEVDILIANAGLPASGRLDSFSAEEIDRALAVNLRAPMLLAHGLLPGMIARRRGHLVFVSSLAGKAPSPRAAVYNATKFGLRGFAGGLRSELRADGVGVSAVFPGFISDAGMHADSGVRLPPGIGTRPPQAVARAVLSAIERDRGEVDVAPLPLRAGAAFAGLAPELASAVARRMGADQTGRSYERGQRHKR